MNCDLDIRESFLQTIYDIVDRIWDQDEEVLLFRRWDVSHDGRCDWLKLLSGGRLEVEKIAQMKLIVALSRGLLFKKGSN